MANSMPPNRSPHPVPPVPPTSLLPLTLPFPPPWERRKARGDEGTKTAGRAPAPRGSAATLTLLALLVCGPPKIAVAAEWAGITPGVSTPEAVRERFGAPSRESRQTLEGYETSQWVYEGAQAPAGMKRMVVDFGLLTPQGYRPTLVRSFLLEPKPGVFAKRAVLIGWGSPDQEGTEEGHEVFFYTRGLVVYFDAGGADAVSMLFAIPQPEPAKPAGR